MTCYLKFRSASWIPWLLRSHQPVSCLISHYLIWSSEKSKDAMYFLSLITYKTIDFSSAWDSLTKHASITRLLTVRAFLAQPKTRACFAVYLWAYFCSLLLNLNLNLEFFFFLVLFSAVKSTKMASNQQSFSEDTLRGTASKGICVCKSRGALTKGIGSPPELLG